MSPCGSCGGKSKASNGYEVTLPDGTVKRVASMAEVRILREQHRGVPGKALTFRPAPAPGK